MPTFKGLIGDIFKELKKVTAHLERLHVVKSPWKRHFQANEICHHHCHHKVPKENTNGVWTEGNRSQLGGIKSNWKAMERVNMCINLKEYWHKTISCFVGFYVQRTKYVTKVV